MSRRILAGGFAIAAGKSGKPDPPTGGNSKWVAEDEDVRLMLDFQGGRDEAFGQIVHRNQEKVYAVIFRVIGNHAQTEDLTQEVFLRVFRTAKRYKPMARFSTWLYRIATNVALNAIRARRKVRSVPLELIDSEDGVGRHRDLPDTRTAPPHVNLDTEELQARLAEAIAALPENQRTSFVLNKYEHMNYREIADVLGCSTMAVKSLLSRARSNLRDAISGYLGHEFLKKLPNP